MGDWVYNIIMFSHSPLLRKMGIKADPARRFLAKDGSRLPEPANLVNG